MPDRMLEDLRRIVERVDTTDGFDAGLSVDFIAEHGPALLARLEAGEAAQEAEVELPNITLPPGVPVKLKIRARTTGAEGREG